MSVNLDYDIDDALARLNTSRKIIDDLRSATIENMPENLTDRQLLLFYSACEHNFNDAVKTIKKYYAHKLAAPEHFTNRDPQSPQVQQCLKNQIYFYLPVTPNGQSVIYHRLANTKPSNYIFDEAIKTYFMTIDSCLYSQGPQSSVIFLFDMKNVNLGHLTRIRISAIKKFFHYVQECVPCKLHEIEEDSLICMSCMTFVERIIEFRSMVQHSNVYFKNLHKERSDSLLLEMKIEESDEQWDGEPTSTWEEGEDVDTMEYLSRDEEAMIKAEMEFMSEDECYEPETESVNSSIPQKSKPVYERIHKKFTEWRTQQNLVVDEQTMLTYYTQVMEHQKFSTRWTHFSILKATINSNDNIDIGKFDNFLELMKKKCDDYEPKKSSILTKEQIEKFIRDADDFIYLAMKVVLVFGVFGGCRKDELLKLNINDVHDDGNSIRVKLIESKKTKSYRVFVVNFDSFPGLDLRKMIRTYRDMRPPVNVDRFFMTYKKGKCLNTPMGINTLATFAKQIATFLNLPAPETYTGHCFRRSSPGLLAHPDISVPIFKRHGSSWKTEEVGRRHGIIKK